jgi:hypothetical protein
MNDPDSSTPTDVDHEGATASSPQPASMELQNDRTLDSTVDTDGKNREAARIAGDGVIGPDEITTSNASPENSVPETPDGMAGFDSRRGGSHVLLALEAGFEMIDKGMVEPQTPKDPEQRLEETVDANARQMRGRIHYAVNHSRPTRLIELRRIK